MDAEPKPLILVVDDDRDVCRLIEDLLSLQGLTVRSYADPLTALAALQTIRPAVILSDVIMPEMDGFTFRERLLQQEATRLIPFIYLTGRDSPDDKIQGMNTDADAYLTKPFSADELVATVANALRRSSRHQESRELDPLTQVFNRLYLEAHGPELLKQCRAARYPFACAMVDIDHFKQINDTYGHATGDLVLTAVAQLIRKHIRKEDILIRYGGEEFLIFLPNQVANTAFLVVERIRKIIASKVFVDASSRHQFHLTISAGMTKVLPTVPLDTVIAQADKMLYEAKRHGRDRTIAALS